MNKHSPIKKPAASLLERASEIYDFGAALRGGAAPVAEQTPTQALPTPAVQAAVPHVTMAARPTSKNFASINRERLAAHNFIVPDGPVTGLSEEFRIVKRQLLLAARGGKGFDALPNGERILVCSAHPNEGKTFCAVNLALSMASEKDNRVLLVDADFAKPSVLSTLGIESSPGLMDALADPASDAENFIIETDVEGLSILPAGAQTNSDTEYLAASRTAAIIEQLTRNDPSRIIIFDSPPALAASPASVLALHVGQTLMVVQADVTTDSALRDALSLLSGCEHVQLLLNRAKFSPTGRKFGNYYGYGA
ncbi:MAG: AAA family ATPase [Sphingorhabdus sp.]